MPLPKHELIAATIESLAKEQEQEHIEQDSGKRSNTEFQIVHSKKSQRHALALTAEKQQWDEGTIDWSSLPDILGSNFRLASNWTVAWVDLVDNRIFRYLHPHQRVNQFPGIDILTRKRNLACLLNQMRKKIPQEYDFYPHSFILPHQWNEIRMFSETKSGMTSEGISFVIKPDSSCEGRGIKIVQNLEALESYLKDDYLNSSELGLHQEASKIVTSKLGKDNSTIDTPQNAIPVVQQYISNPLLINRRKFDLRIYVLITSLDPLRVYVHDEGLVRFCTSDYVNQNGVRCGLNDSYGHLTNYAVNKTNPSFVFSNGATKDDNHCSKWSLNSFWNYLSHEKNINPLVIQSEIHDIIVKTIIAALPNLKSQFRAHCGSPSYSGSAFQFLGIDILLDEEARPHLIEINRNPSLKCDTSLDIAIKTKIIGDLINLINPLTFMPASSILQNEMKIARQLHSSEFRQWKAFRDTAAVAKRIKYEDTIRNSTDNKWTLAYPSSSQNTAKYESLLQIADSLLPKPSITKRITKTSVKSSR